MDRDGSAATLLAFLADTAVTTAQKKAVFIIPISRCTLNTATKNISAINLPASGDVYNYVITTPTPITYTIKVPILSSSTVTVRRKTVSNEPLVNWVAGSRLTSKQLNLATTQSLYLLQEAIEKIGTSLTLSATQITVVSLADAAVTPSKISTTTDPWSFYGTIQTVAPTANLHATTRLYTLDKFFQHGVMTKDDVAPTSSAVDILETAATAGNSGLWFNPKNGTINLWAGNAWVTVAGTPVTTANLVSTNTVQTLTAAKTFAAGTVIPFTQTGTGAVARTVDAKLKDTVSVKDFGAVGDGVTDDTAAIQAAITAGAGKTVILTSGTYKTTGVLTMSAANTNLVGVGKVNTTIAWSGAGGAYVVGVTNMYGTTGNAAILVTGSNCTINGLTIKGPTAASYVASERLVVVCGTATGSRVNRFSISNCLVKESGSAGVILIFVSDFRIQDCEVSNIGYEAIETISCNRGMITGNYVHDITPGTSNNMYCISLSHDSSLWATDQTTSPFTDDVIVSGNRCENCAWEGITNHGGNRHTVIGNQIYNVPRCISLGKSSGAAANYSGGDHVVMGNYCDAGPTYANNVNAFCNFGGGTSQTLTNVKIIGNTFRRLGVADYIDGAIRTSIISGLHISGNFFKSWRGSAIYLAGGSTIYVGGNDISQMAAADTIGYAIYTDNDISALRIIGNTIRTDGGTIANRGIMIYSGQTTAVVMQANEIEATSISVSPQLITNNNTPELRYITSPAGTYDVSNGGSHMTLVFDLAAPQTITNFTNAKYGQQLTIINTTANNLTIDRTNAYLSGGVNSVLGQYDSLRIVYYTNWYALGAVSANS